MMPTLELGGPGPGCSAMAVRRLVAGELQGPERDRLADHVKGCARCQATERELTEERAALVAAMPFDRFAAGVAERLAAPSRSFFALPPLRRVVPLVAFAVAACLVVALGATVWADCEEARHWQELAARFSDARAVATRVKGGAGATVYVQDRAGSRLLGPHESVPAGAKLLLALEPAGHRFAAAALVDRDGPSALYAGPAKQGPLPRAFEWTGKGTARVVVEYADQPIDEGAFLELAGKGLRPPAGAEQVALELKR